TKSRFFTSFRMTVMTLSVMSAVESSHACLPPWCLASFTPGRVSSPLDRAGAAAGAACGVRFTGYGSAVGGEFSGAGPDLCTGGKEAVRGTASRYQAAAYQAERGAQGRDDDRRRGRAGYHPVRDGPHPLLRGRGRPARPPASNGSARLGGLR